MTLAKVFFIDLFHQLSYVSNKRKGKNMRNLQVASEYLIVDLYCLGRRPLTLNQSNNFDQNIEICVRRFLAANEDPCTADTSPLKSYEKIFHEQQEPPCLRSGQQKPVLGTLGCDSKFSRGIYPKKTLLSKRKETIKRFPVFCAATLKQYLTELYFF